MLPVHIMLNGLAIKWLDSIVQPPQNDMFTNKHGKVVLDGKNLPDLTV